MSLSNLTAVLLRTFTGNSSSRYPDLARPQGGPENFLTLWNTTDAFLNVPEDQNVERVASAATTRAHSGSALSEGTRRSSAPPLRLNSSAPRIAISSRVSRQSATKEGE